MTMKPTKHLSRDTEAVADILQSYLKSVCDVYSEQRAIRMEIAM